MVSALSIPMDMGRNLKRNVFSAGGEPPPVPARPLDAKIGEVVKVQGYTLTPASGVMASGGDVELSILFECVRNLPEGWRFFFHIIGPGGSFRNLDHVPVEGAMPPERWRPGQRILDRVRIAFPAGTPAAPTRFWWGYFAALTAWLSSRERWPMPTKHCAWPPSKCGSGWWSADRGAAAASAAEGPFMRHGWLNCVRLRCAREDSLCSCF